MKKTSVLFWLLSITLLLSACGNKNPCVSSDVDDYIGAHYKIVIAEFEKAGFKDIETVVIDDLTSTGTVTDGSVGSIQINDIDSFSAGDKFPPDAKVLITYHIIKKLKTPVASNTIQEYSCEEIQEAFFEAGFTNVSITEEYDLDPDTMGGAYQNEVFIENRASFEKDEEMPFDANISIICHYPYEKYTVQLHVDFIANLIFSKYDVVLAIDGVEQDTLKHGTDMDYEFRLKGGEHSFTFSNVEDTSVKGETTLDVACDIESSYTIYCRSDIVDVTPIFVDYKNELSENEAKIICSESNFWGKDYQEVIVVLEELGFSNIKAVPVYDIYFGITKAGSTAGVSINGLNDYKRGDVFSRDTNVIVTYHLSYEDDPNNQTNPENVTDNSKSETSNSDTQTNKPVSFSTNDWETAKNGNSGVFSYKSTGGTYDNYWIIDFDEGYVYYFSEGNGNTGCDRLKIDSGTLNDVVIITYHDGDDVWSYGLHFNWKNQPDTLILQDNDGFEYKLFTTNLESALEIRDSKNIRDY